MWELQYKIALWALVLGILPAGIFLLMWRSRNRQVKRIGDAALLDKLMPSRSSAKPVVRIVLFSIAFILLLVALINPMIGTKKGKVATTGIDVVIALDISNSMLAEDLKPSRLSAAKNALRALMNRMGENRIGIVVFAGTAYTQLPLTSDYNAAEVFIDDISTNDIARQGTAIGAAIERSSGVFSKLEGRGKAIIIISDGENHEDDAEASARKAAEDGIIVNTIGLGSPKGAPIPIYKNGINVGFKTDRQGNTVMTRLNEQMLQQIAAAGNGIYVHGTDGDVGINTILSELGRLKKQELSEVQFTSFESLYPWFALAALLFLFFESLIGDRKYGWIGRSYKPAPVKPVSHEKQTE